MGQFWRPLRGLAYRRLTSALLAALLCVPVPCPGAEPSAKELYKRGRKYEKKKDYGNAYLYYAKAAAADPGRKEYWQRAQALQRRAIRDANILPASVENLASGSPGAQEEVSLPSAEPAEIREAKSPQPPVELHAAADSRDFDLRADSKALWEQVAKAYALDVVFDGDYQAGQPQRFHITGADYRNALYALMTATSSFIVPVSEKLIMVVKDTEAKRREVENTVAVSIPIPEPFSVQEAQELGRTVQQIMEIQRFAIDSAQRLVVLRDRASKVGPAQLLFQELLHSRAQVVLDVELLAASSSTAKKLGTTLPTSTVISPLVQTLTLAGGPLSFGLAIGSATVIANATKSEARSLFQAELRSVDGQAAELKVGQKYPIQTLGYIGTVPSGQTAYTPPPSFNFEDLGFNLKFTPKVHDRNEVTLEIDTDFKLLGAGSVNGIPVISNRKFATHARLRFDEAAVISGLVTHSDMRVLTGPAGLLNLPVLGVLLGTGSWNRDDVDVLLVVTPRLITPPASELITHEIWLGSESRPRLPM